jgi:hypothetical protein
MVKNCVILSTALILQPGAFTAHLISIDEARQWVKKNNPKNFCGHATTLAVGVEPSKSREVCEGYDEALVLKPLGRLEFGREYTLEEVLAIGVQPMLVIAV